MPEPRAQRTQASQRTRARVDEALADFSLDPSSLHSASAQRAVFLARRLQTRAAALQTPEERRQQAELERMVQSPHDRATLTQLTDQAFRSARAERAADQLIHILDVQGIPRFFTAVERTLLRGFQSFGSYLPGVAMPLVKEKMRDETANVILPAEPELLAAHLRARRESGVRMNVNLLGEALLGEGEAEARLAAYLEALQRPEIEVLSVKISTLYSQISPLAWDHTVGVLCDRLERLYRTAARMRFVRADGSETPKFVYLDMEEYRDLRVTAEVFTRTLERPGLEAMEAGIALQAYLPDSFAVQQHLQAWARERVARGGAPITLRLVKGANLQMERLEAAHRGWPQAPFATKGEVDAHFKRMLEAALAPENRDAVRLGVASHNLFELAYGLVRAREAEALGRVQLEMLEGMANHVRRALCEIASDVLLYAPATRRETFVHAIAYLVRRLDENTGPDNFLRHAFKLEVGSEDWERLERQFLASFARVEALGQVARRSQDRRAPPELRTSDDLALAAFRNEPDTDFALAANVAWAQELYASWQPRCGDAAPEVPVVVGGAEHRGEGVCAERRDPSRPGVVVARVWQGSRAQLDTALRCARDDPSDWRRRTPAERSAVLGSVADGLRASRAQLMGAALAGSGKVLSESDPEVSEAVDFVEYYRRSAGELAGLARARGRGRGVVAVVPPWNFPIAIPCGGTAAALAAGNTVILKPAPEAELVAFELCRCFWEAGVPREALQLLPCAEQPVASDLVASPEVDAVVLTGGTETALAMLCARPEMTLFAETGGKNATIVTALADREQAIAHVLRSAFGHAGQKCSATSLLVLEEEVYEDEGFRATLRDAAASLAVGSAWDPETRVGPLIRPPTGPLARALEVLEPGESWLLAPQRRSDNPHVCTPGIKWGVAPGSPTHMTELFGPLLGVMRARDLQEAVRLVNQTGYGLTSGLESLDDREQAFWLQHVRAGNLYVNRSTTGAIVQRQPFGGMGKSSFGPGIKAGGPSYCAQLMTFEARDEAAALDVEIVDPALAQLARALRDEPPPGFVAAVRERVVGALASYAEAARSEFLRAHDPTGLPGQENLRRYLVPRGLRIRVHAEDDAFDVIARVAAARVVGCRATVSVGASPPTALLDWLHEATEPWAAALEFVEEADMDLAAALRAGQTERVRYAAPGRVEPAVREAARDSGVFVADAPVLAEGRLELLWYVREQTVSRDTHRYGHLGEVLKLPPGIPDPGEQVSPGEASTSWTTASRPPH